MARDTSSDNRPLASPELTVATLQIATPTASKYLRPPLSPSAPNIGLVTMYPMRNMVASVPETESSRSNSVLMRGSTAASTNLSM